MKLTLFSFSKQILQSVQRQLQEDPRLGKPSIAGCGPFTATLSTGITGADTRLENCRRIHQLFFRSKISLSIFTLNFLPHNQTHTRTFTSKPRATKFMKKLTHANDQAMDQKLNQVFAGFISSLRLFETELILILTRACSSSQERARTPVSTSAGLSLSLAEPELG